MRRNVMIFILGLYSALVFAGEPKWITDVESEFPNTEYIRAVGEGKSEAVAKRGALAELSSYFGQTIKSENFAKQSSRQSDSSYEEKASLWQNLDTSSEVDLFCVHYTTAWYNMKSDIYYVCAYIERTEIWEVLVAKMDSLSDKFDSVIANSKSEKDSFKKMLILENAKSFYEEYEQMYKMSLAIYPKKCSQYERFLEKSLNELQELSRLKNDLTVSVLVYGDKQNKIRTKICELLTQKGIIVNTDNRTCANFALVASVIWNDSQLNSVYSSKPQFDLNINGPQGTVFSYSGICEKVSSYNLQTTENLSFLRLEELLDDIQLWR